jgi:hypothetical protein
VVKEIGSASSLAMIEARRWRHDELAGSVDLEAFGPIGEGGIGADFEPPFGGRIVGQASHEMACGKAGQREEIET